jgi:hypothetical protein
MNRVRLQLGSMGIVGRIFGTLFLLVFLVIGVIFCRLIGLEVYRSARTFKWTKTECVILESSVSVSEPPDASPYKFAVRYQYTWQGQDYTSTQGSLQSRSYSEYNQARQWVDRFPADTMTTCWVNPSAPSEAVLVHADLWMGLFLLIPLVFVAVGVFGIQGLWKGFLRNQSTPEPALMPISSRKVQNLWPGWLVLFAFVFFAVGGVAFYFMAVKPVGHVLLAKNWKATPCTVISSRIQSHASDDGSTYRVDILYTYEFNGQSFRSSRYSFMGGSSSGYARKAEIVNRHPPGKHTTCYVDPNHPLEAVLERGFTNDMWFGLIPLVFVIAGAGGMYLAIRHWRKTTSSSVQFQPGMTPGSSTSAHRGATSTGVGPVVLKPKWSRLGQLMISLVLACFWNGIVAVPVWQVINSWRRGHPEWFLTLFMIPFVAVGIGLIAFVIYSFLRLFNPSVNLTVSGVAVPLGGALELTWNITGRSQVISKLRIYLEGREEATYQRGTSSQTDKAVFATLELATLTPPNDLRSGRTRIQIPTRTMHSFASGHNQITWTLCVAGDIARWPDIKDEYKIQLLPLAASQASTL